MSRYISLDWLNTHTNYICERGRKDISRIIYADKLNDAPSIDICFCRECEHWNEEDHWCNIRDSYGWDYKPDDFCSYGEREGE